MDRVELLTDLHLLKAEVGHAYLWRDPDGLTLIDTGLAGSQDDIAATIMELGARTSDLRRVVLTHFHEDHAGSAAAIAGWGEVSILAHWADAPIIRGEMPGPPPVLTDWERPIYDRVHSAGLPPAPPVHVDRELNEGDVVEFGGGARIISIPGHTDGSIAIHLPEHGVLFTGDAVANVAGTIMLGVFNLDRERAAASFRRLAALDADVACFGHGDPIVGGAAPALRAAAA